MATKPASGVRFYGYRYYDPVTGRWPSRDPIGDPGFGLLLYPYLKSIYSRPFEGERNDADPYDYEDLMLQATLEPYAFVANSPTGEVDLLGWCEVGDTQGCRISDIYLGFQYLPGEIKRQKERKEAFDKFNKWVGVMNLFMVQKGAFNAKLLESAMRFAEGQLGKGADVAVDNVIHSILRYYEDTARLNDQLQGGYIWVIVDYEECESGWFGTTRWCDRRGKYECKNKGRGGRFRPGALKNKRILAECSIKALRKYCPEGK